MTTDEHMRRDVMENWADPEWDCQDSNRHQDRVERGSEALEYMLAGNPDDAETAVCGLEDADLEAIHRAADDLAAMIMNELGRRHS